MFNIICENWDCRSETSDKNVIDKKFVTSYVSIKIILEHDDTKMTIHSNSLGDSEKWVKLITAINENNMFDFHIDGFYHQYIISHENQILNLSVDAHDKVRSLDVKIKLTDEVKKNIIEIKNMADCIKNGFIYEPSK